MPAISCPQCGAPTRVSLATPDWMSCASCRYAGAPDARVRQELHAARAALWAADARRRQLGWAQQRLGAGARSGGGLGCLLAVIVFPFASCGGFVFFGTFSGNLADIGTAIMFLGPAIFILVAGGLILREVKKTRRLVEASCAAVPPAVPGAPLGCHVCGADLPSLDLSRVAVVRCRYCSADNVVRKDVLGAAVALGIQATDALMAQVGRHATALYQYKRRSMGLLVALVLLAPFASCLGGMGTYVVSPTVEATDKYVLVRTDAGLCVARQIYQSSEGRRTLVFGPRSPYPKHADLHYERDTPTFRAAELAGAKGRSLDIEGKITSAERNAFVGTELVRLAGMPDRTFQPEDFCFAEEPEGLRAVELP